MRDVVIHIISGLISGVLIFFAGLHWRLITSYLRRDVGALRRLFGRASVRQGKIVITLDTYRDVQRLPAEYQHLLGAEPSPTSSSHPNRFFKLFPDGQCTAFPETYTDLLGYCSARGAAYLINGLSGIGGLSVEAVSDEAVTSEWDATYINLGGSSSNLKTDHIKRLPQNLWLVEDRGELRLKDGRVIKNMPRIEKGIILKVPNPYFSGHSLLVCAGLGEWGTSGAAWFLATHWRSLSRRFGVHPFLIVVGVTASSDQSAIEDLALGEEDFFWRMRATVRTRIRALWSRSF